MVTADIAENNLIELLKEFDFMRNRISLRSNLQQCTFSLHYRKIALLLNVGKSTVTGLINSTFSNLKRKKR